MTGEDGGEWGWWLWLRVVSIKGVKSFFLEGGEGGTAALSPPTQNHTFDIGYSEIINL